MRFLVDECTGPAVARWLRDQSHEVFSVYEEARGTGDDVILERAYSENWILITNDKDFGEKVHREKKSRIVVSYSFAFKTNELRRRLTRSKNCLMDTKINWQAPLSLSLKHRFGLVKRNIHGLTRRSTRARSSFGFSTSSPWFTLFSCANVNRNGSCSRLPWSLNVIAPIG